VVRASPGGAIFIRGTDYEAELTWGCVGRLAGGAISDTTPVYASYVYGKMRLDSVVLTAAGQIVLREGVSNVSLPVPPELAAGETRLANVWVTARMTKLDADHLFPVLETAYPEAPKSPLASADKLLPKTIAKLDAGGQVHVLAWGDSVTDGGFLPDAVTNRWQAQFAQRLQAHYPNAEIVLTTEAWGGHNTDSYRSEPPGSLHNYQEKVLDVHPDLIVSEFVNDSGFDEAAVYQKYGLIRDEFAAIGAEWIILTPHYVRPDMMGLSSEKNIDDDPRAYVKALRKFTAQYGIALAEGSLRYGRLWRRGTPYSTLLMNNINHPNPFGMSLFADALMEAMTVVDTATWDGGGGDSSWGTALNWDDDTVPTFPAALTFAGFTRLTPTNDQTGVTVNGITFAAGAGAFALGGNAVTLGGDVTIALGGGVTNDQTINFPITLGMSPVLTAAPVPGHFAGNKGVLVINGAISGPFGLTSGVTGATKNYVQLNGANTYSGDTLITGSDASFSIGNAGAFGSGKLIVGATPGDSQMWIQSCGNQTITNNVEILTGRFISGSATVAGKAAGNLTLSGNILLNQGTSGGDLWCQKDLTLSGAVSGGGTYGMRMASGKVNLQGVNTFTNHVRTTNADGATFNINSDAALGHTNNGVMAVFSTTLQTAAATTISLAPGRTFTISAGKTVTFDVPANSSLTVPGLITGGTAGSNTLSKTSAGTLVLSGSNTFSGGTVVNAGVLNITGDAALGAPTGPVTFRASATLQAGATNVSLSANRAINATNAGTYTATFDVPTNFTLSVAGPVKGNVSTNSTLAKTGPGKLILAGGSAGTALAGMRAQGGTLSIQGGVWYTAPASVDGENPPFCVLGGASYEQTGGTNYLPLYPYIGVGFIPDPTTNMTSVGIISGGALVGGISTSLLVGRRNSAVLTVSGSALVDVYSLALVEVDGYAAAVNLDGGVVACNCIVARGTNSASVLNLNGGTLRAKANQNIIGYNNTYLNYYLTRVNVKSGGAVIDSQGYAVAIPQVLNHDAGLGATPDGGLTKRGTGSLTLATTNTYTGVTSIEAGTLKLGVANTLSTNVSVLVASNAVFDVNSKNQTLAGLGGSGLVTNNSLLTVTQGVAPGGTNAICTLTLAATPAALSGLFVVDVATNGVCDRLRVQGNLSLTGLTLSLANPQALNKNYRYVIASCTGALSIPFGSLQNPLPDRWHVTYDASAGQALLSYNFGTLLMVR